MRRDARNGDAAAQGNERNQGVATNSTDEPQLRCAVHGITYFHACGKSRDGTILAGNLYEFLWTC